MRWMEPWVNLLCEGIMLARLNVNTKRSVDSSLLTASKPHSKLQSWVRGLRRDRDEGRPRSGSEEGEESGMGEKTYDEYTGAESELRYHQYQRQQIGI